uniref:TNFR-Cys domain-containing protein n=1 Tax=Astyanax mexicanus TaxID=7994 RepID=A0A3B1KBR1_ASTMX
ILEAVFVAVVILKLQLCYSACARAEYARLNGECCPMCAPGNRVYRDCTEFITTTCVPCSGSSYTSQPNNLLSCLPCTLCDPSWGLRVKTVCTRQSDAVCETRGIPHVLITDQEAAIQATEHSKCSPGEYIQQTGQHASVLHTFLPVTLILYSILHSKSEKAVGQSFVSYFNCRQYELMLRHIFMCLT